MPGQIEEDVFQRQGQDLILELDISMVDAALGMKVEIPTLDDPTEIQIPKGTQSGEVFQLRGLGLPHIGTSRMGDLLVEVKVHTPRKVSKKQEELLREFQKLEEDKPMEKVKNFFKKAKKATMGE